MLHQEGALTALASVADAANAHFIRYYDTVMPMLKNILYSSASKAEQLLRAKALECVSLVGMAVGKERFRADAQEVMAFMQQLQVSMHCMHTSAPPLGRSLLNIGSVQSHGVHIQQGTGWRLGCTHTQASELAAIAAGRLKSA